MKTQNQWEKLFEEFLDITEFSLVKHKDGWGLYDLQGADLGGISYDRFTTAEQIFDRMGIYIDDYYINDIENEVLSDDETFDDYEDLVGILGAKLDDNSLSEDMRRTIEHHYNIMCMIVHYCNEINLNNCYYEEEE